MRRIHKLLIAEDELLIAKVLRLQLEQEGYEVENVVDGDSAFEHAMNQSFDLIIMDNYLKNDTNGIHCALKIREHGNKVPIIFVTGNSYDATLDLVKEIQFSRVMSKPVIFEELVAIIKKIEVE